MTEDLSGVGPAFTRVWTRLGREEADGRPVEEQINTSDFVQFY